MGKYKDKPWSLEKYMAIAEQEMLEAANKNDSFDGEEATRVVGAIKEPRRRWRRRLISLLKKTVKRRKQLEVKKIESRTEEGSVRDDDKVQEIISDMDELSVPHSAESSVSITLPSRQGTHLGQDVYNLIISFTTDRPTLHAWQQVNADSYNAATPRLYTGRIELTSESAYLSFVTGLRAIPQDIEAPTPRLVKKSSFTARITSVGLCGFVDHEGDDVLLLRLGPTHPCEIEIHTFHFPPLAGLVTTSLPQEAKYWLNETLKRDCRIGGLEHWRQRDPTAPIYCSSIVAEFTSGVYPGSLESFEFGLEPPPEDHESAKLSIRSRFVHAITTSWCVMVSNF